MERGKKGAYIKTYQRKKKMKEKGAKGKLLLRNNSEQ